MLKTCTAICLFIFISLNTTAEKLIKFSSEDGIEISADLYMPHPDTAPIIILLHQANWSRGEYIEIAPELNALGYNCLAVDLRSGGAVNNVTNLTKVNASKAMKSTQYADAQQDIKSAIKYAKKNLTTDKVIVWGSSYSSALALKLAGSMKEIDAVLAFSPGEYFVNQGKARDYVSSEAVNINVPVFITSARSEKSNWWGIYVGIGAENKAYFLPETAGNHGSKALWPKFSDSKDYWQAVKSFLSSL